MNRRVVVHLALVSKPASPTAKATAQGAIIVFMAADSDAHGYTTEASPHAPAAIATVPRLHLEIVEGPRRGQRFRTLGVRCTIGSHERNDLIVEDPTVSRFHCEIDIDRRGVQVRDLASRNGTILDGVPVVDAFARDGSLLRLGNTVVRLQLGREQNRVALSEHTSFGSLVGVSAAMREVFALLELAAASDVTVLLQGETGTGKGEAAESLHLAGARAKGPFEVVDCGAIPAGLIESELFGHERGAFTGAVTRHTGAFERASGGTLFLDEVGELPLDLQPKLLRAVEQQEVRPVGSDKFRKIDVRIVAATCKDLRSEVNAGHFRSDLYFRFAVLAIRMPPLRARPEDLPVLVERALTELGAREPALSTLRSPTFLEHLKRSAWPGNVRELRNHLQRCLVIQSPLTLDDAAPEPAAVGSYDEAREHALRVFERDYVQRLLAAHDGRVSAAAHTAGIDRAYLYRLLKRHGISGRTA
jgi:two-component system response regulator GlrR